MSETATRAVDGRAAALHPCGRAWHRDYSICACPRHYDECPHCGLPGADANHRGRCHARSEARSIQPLSPLTS